MKISTSSLRLHGEEWMIEITENIRLLGAEFPDVKFDISFDATNIIIKASFDGKRMKHNITMLEATDAKVYMQMTKMAEDI